MVAPRGLNGKFGSETSSLPGGPFGDSPVGVALEARRVEGGPVSAGPPSLNNVKVDTDLMDVADSEGQWLDGRKRCGKTDKSRGGVTKQSRAQPALGPGPSAGTSGSRPVRGGSRGCVHVDRPGKDPVFSRTCVTLEEQRERAGDLFDRTVVVKVLQGGGTHPAG